MKTTGNTALQSGHSRWDLMLLRQQMSELKRERRHLESKSDERPLSNWESQRMEQLMDEVMALLEQFGKLNQHQLARIK